MFLHMVHYIIFFISDTHHQSRKVNIGRITIAVVKGIIFVRLLIANLIFLETKHIYEYTKSDLPDKHLMKKIQNSTFRIF